MCIWIIYMHNPVKSNESGQLAAGYGLLVASQQCNRRPLRLAFMQII